jgi:hypothetical protein
MTPRIVAQLTGVVATLSVAGLASPEWRRRRPPG